MFGKIFLHQLHCISLDINSPLGLLYIACYMFADGKVYHTRGKVCSIFLV
jgi:hypothetical protein